MSRCRAVCGVSSSLESVSSSHSLLHFASINTPTLPAINAYLFLSCTSVLQMSVAPEFVLLIDIFSTQPVIAGSTPGSISWPERSTYEEAVTTLFLTEVIRTTSKAMRNSRINSRQRRIDHRSLSVITNLKISVLRSILARYPIQTWHWVLSSTLTLQRGYRKKGSSPRVTRHRHRHRHISVSPYLSPLHKQ